MALLEQTLAGAPPFFLPPQHSLASSSSHLKEFSPSSNPDRAVHMPRDSKLRVASVCVAE